MYIYGKNVAREKLRSKEDIFNDCCGNDNHGS